jgi:hypothetical protein
MVGNLSLRAERSNPAQKRRCGLLRRFTPRNDVCEVAGSIAVIVGQRVPPLPTDERLRDCDRRCSPRPAGGERSRASCERVRGTLGRLGLADTPPHPETSLRSVSVIASGAKQSISPLAVLWIASSLHSSQRHRCRPCESREVDSHSKCNTSQKASAGVLKSRHFRGMWL